MAVDFGSNVHIITKEDEDHCKARGACQPISLETSRRTADFSVVVDVAAAYTGLHGCFLDPQARPYEASDISMLPIADTTGTCTSTSSRCFVFVANLSQSERNMVIEVLVRNLMAGGW